MKINEIVTEAKAMPDTNLKVGDKVTANTSKEKAYPGGHKSRSGTVTRVGQTGVHIKPDDGGDIEYHPYKIVSLSESWEQDEEKESYSIWNELGEGISIEDRMTVIETYYSNQNLKESNSSDNHAYFTSLFSLSNIPKSGREYIAVPLALISDKVIILDRPSVLLFVKEEGGSMMFDNNGEYKSYPAVTIKQSATYNTFTFKTILAYNKFKTAIALKFSISLPNIDISQVNEEGVGIITKQNSTQDVNKSTPRKNLKAFKLVK